MRIFEEDDMHKKDGEARKNNKSVPISRKYKVCFFARHDEKKDTCEPEINKVIVQYIVEKHRFDID